MIYYVCHPSHTYTCAVILLWYGDSLKPVFRLVPYGVLQLLHNAAPGVIIWTDFDRLTSDELKDAARIRAEIEREDLLHLNHPARSEQRFDMLLRLYREGRNPFGVRRAYEPLDGLRYPVFLRDEVGALKKAPKLLRDRAALEPAIVALMDSELTRPMIVEFSAQPGPDGYYRKYGAYRVGERIVPQHCFASSEWFIKLASNSPQHYSEHLEYVERNPHAAELMMLFDAAKIEYGRIDYTMIDGRVQVFEINTNPAVLGLPPKPEDTYDQTPYATRHIEALLALPNATIQANDSLIDFAHDFKLRQMHEFYGGHI